MNPNRNLLICLTLLAGCGSCDDDQKPFDGDTSLSDAGNSADSNVDMNADITVDDLGNLIPVSFVPDIDALDETFGNGGLSTITSSPGGLATIWDLDVDDDGKIVGFGRAFESSYVFRLTSAGARDASFGNAGIVYLPYGKRTFSFQYKVGNVEIGADDSIFVSHWYSPFSRLISNGFVAKLDSSGQLSSDFAENGVHRSTIQSFSHGVQLSSEGGRYISADPARITGLDSDGSPDAFDLNLPNMRMVFEFKELADGSWLGAGRGTNQAPTLVKLTQNLEIDTAFGDEGWVVVEHLGNDLGGFWDFDIDSEARIVAVGAAENAENDLVFAVARFSTDGVLDTTFGDAGWVRGQTRGVGFGVKVIEGDKIVVVGQAEFVEDDFLSVVQLDADGTLGWTISAPMIQAVLAIESTEDGSLLIGGGNTVSKIGLDGAFDSSFGDSGTATIPESHSVEFGSVAYEEDDGSLLVAGTVDGIATKLSRIEPDGTVDAAFPFSSPLARLVPLDVKSIAKHSDGAYLFGGRVTNGNEFFFVKLLPDNTFENILLPIPETQVAWPMATAFVSSTEVYTAGIFGDGVGLRVGVVKSDENGTIDMTFGNAGRASAPIPPGAGGTFDDAQVSKAADGKIVVRYNERILRFNTDGTPDPSIAAEGFIDGFTSLHPLSDGKFLVRLSADPVQIARLMSDFTFDDTFNGGAPLTLETNGYFDIGFVVEDDGSFFVVSATGGPLTTNAYIVSVNADGTLDGTFGNNGELNMKLSEHSSSLKSGFLNRAGQLVGIGHAWTFKGGSDVAVVRFD